MIAQETHKGGEIKNSNTGGCIPGAILKDMISQSMSWMSKTLLKWDSQVNLLKEIVRKYYHIEIE